MSLPKPAPKYDTTDQSKTRQAIDQALSGAYSKNADVEITGTQRFIMTSPNGTRYALSVSNAGASVWTAV